MVQLHALRAEILVNCVLADVVPASETEPFLYWMRFEFGKNGSPHVHGQCYVAGNPHFETVVKDEAARVSLKAAGRRDVDFLPAWHEAEQQLGTFFHNYILESHPCKDIVGNKRFDFHTDLLTNPFCARPQAFQLLTELKAILTSWRPDLSRHHVCTSLPTAYARTPSATQPRLAEVQPPPETVVLKLGVSLMYCSDQAALNFSNSEKIS